MKNALPHRALTATVHQFLFFLSLLCLSPVAFGQQFMPPSAAHYEFTYPAPAAGTQSVNSSNYSIGLGWPGFPAPNLWLMASSWEFGCAGSGFAWQAFDWTTNVPYDQGFMMLPAGVTDVNVGIIHAGTYGIQVNVSYYLQGTGHFVDVYDWDVPASLGGGGTGCTLAFSLQLSCLTSYTRISMDSHKGYGTAIVWEDYTAGANDLHLIAANNNNFGPVFNLTGTAGYVTPDCAFTHAGPLDIQIASYDPASASIIENSVNWNNIIPGGAAAIACGAPPLCTSCGLIVPTNDINAVAAAPQSLHIDAPDHYNNNNWAYVYEIGNDIFCRIWNPNAPPWPAPAVGGFATVCFTNSYYNGPNYNGMVMPTFNNSTCTRNTVPVIAWDHQPTVVNYMGATATQFSFYVAWHTSYNDVITPYNATSDAYIAIQVNEDGLVRNPTPMPFNFFGVSNVPGNISPTPTIALSKNNDASPMLYSAFAENGGCNFLQNRFTAWNVGVFKPGHTDNTHEAAVSVSPNPFKDGLHLNFEDMASVEDQNIKVKICDMLGQEIGSYDNAIHSVNHYLGTLGRKLAPGNYILKVECEKADVHQSFKVVKTD